MATATETPKMDLKTAVKRPFIISKPADITKYLKVLIYGPPGVGKTTLAAGAISVPEMCDVLYIDAESGAETLRKIAPKIDSIPINNFGQLARIHQFLRLHCKARDEGDMETLKQLEEKVIETSRPKPALYQTVVIDTLSEVQKYNMYQLLGVDIDTAKLDQEWEPPEFSEWNKTTEMIRLLVRAFRDLPLHVIFISHERVADEKRGTITVDFPSALARSIPGFVSAVGYLQAATSKNADGEVSTRRRLELEPGRQYLAKHRFGEALKGKSGLEDPTMQELYALRQIALDD